MKIKLAAFISLLILNFLEIDAFGKIIKYSQKNSETLAQKKISRISQSYNFYPQVEINKFINLIANNIEDLPNENLTNLKSFTILSKKQIRTPKYFLAEGQVAIQNGGSLIVAEKFEYSYESKKISLKGNIKFYSQGQFFEASEFNYDLNNKTGFFKDIFGAINFNSLDFIKLEKDINYEVKEDVFKDTEIKNVKLNNTSVLGVEELDLESEGTLINKVSSQKFILDINEPQEWRFKSNRIDINNNEWFAEELLLTNDPFNKPQLVIRNKGFKSTSSNGEILLKSKWTSIVLDDKLVIPTGPRRYKIDEDYIFRWGIGYDRTSKDGLFITRNFDPKYFGKKKQIKLNLKKEFYLQRALEGKTKSFSDKNESILAAKSERDAEFLDYLGLEGNLQTKLGSFDFDSDFSLNSLNPEFLSKSITNKSKLSKILYSEVKATSKNESKFSLFGNYRDKVWNGSLGEREIISAYGLKIINEKNWEDNNVIKTSTIAASIGDYKSSDRIDFLKIINKKRLNIFLERTHSYPIWKAKKSTSFKSDNIYSPEVISSGLNLNAQAKIDLYRYSDNNHQNLFIFKAGPELVIGDFKRKIFDFSKISLFYKTTLSEGNSPFGFDQSTDNNTIEFNLKQQLFGPITFDYKTEYNLDINSPSYKEFFNTKYDLTWNRRAYSVSIFYNQATDAGGLNFKINSFNFDGYGKNF